jgi:hypothetical protein
VVSHARQDFAPSAHRPPRIHFLPKLQLFSRHTDDTSKPTRALRDTTTQTFRVPQEQVWQNSMSSDHETGAPFTLATLPTNGRTQAASVCSISGVKKRKRTEVAVALDGEGLFIYSVCLTRMYWIWNADLEKLVNPQLATSHTLPSPDLQRMMPRNWCASTKHC